VTSAPHGRPTGRFSFDAATGKWDWDDDVFRIHGLAPGSVTPTTDLVLASKHPDDRDRVRELLERVSRSGEAFSISYRLIGGDGVERRVVLVGEGGVCEDDEPATIEGYYIDLTPDFDEESEEHAQQAVAASVESRAVIEQAKGALMLAYGLDSEQAFAMLRWWSRNRNVKVRELAERLVALARDGEASDVELRTSLDAAMHDLTS
jgi:aryl carrier-like protein